MRGCVRMERCRSGGRDSLDENDEKETEVD